MEFLTTYEQLLSASLISSNKNKVPKGLYAPIDYLLSLGGKRLRPVLVLMACEAFGTDAKEGLSAAKAIEIFHNFTLMHDDIMDNAAVRRGQQTVHQKWDINTAILSGDAMLIQAYECLNLYPSDQFKVLTQLLSNTALEVCEGQQLDVDFETSSDVSIAQYLEMIRLKTAVLVGCAVEMGALIGGADPPSAKLLYRFGEQLGIAFQLQDDYLDTFGDPATFGKRIGGDIAENKKTILVHLTYANGTVSQQQELTSWFSEKHKDDSTKIMAVIELFKAAKADSAALAEVARYTKNAFDVLDGIPLNAIHKQRFKDFGNWLMKRTQ